MSDKKLPVEFRRVFDTERDARLAMELVKWAHVAHAPPGSLPWGAFHRPDCGTRLCGCAPDYPKAARELQLADCPGLARRGAGSHVVGDILEGHVRTVGVKVGERFVCAHCGPGVKADEAWDYGTKRGYCATCGMDCTVERGVIPPRPAEYVELDPFEEE
jgi:hypothetical protein